MYTPRTNVMAMSSLYFFYHHHCQPVSFSASAALALSSQLLYEHLIISINVAFITHKCLRCDSPYYLQHFVSSHVLANPLCSAGSVCVSYYKLTEGARSRCCTRSTQPQSGTLFRSNYICSVSFCLSTPHSHIFQIAFIQPYQPVCT
jgi:hypothetical protein